MTLEIYSKRKPHPFLGLYSKRISFNRLPNELKLLCFSFLDIEALLRLLRTAYAPRCLIFSLGPFPKKVDQISLVADFSNEVTLSVAWRGKRVPIKLKTHQEKDTIEVNHHLFDGSPSRLWRLTRSIEHVDLLLIPLWTKPVFPHLDSIVRSGTPQLERVLKVAKKEARFFPGLKTINNVQVESTLDVVKTIFDTFRPAIHNSLQVEVLRGDDAEISAYCSTLFEKRSCFFWGSASKYYWVFMSTPGSGTIFIEDLQWFLFKGLVNKVLEEGIGDSPALIAHHIDTAQHTDPEKHRHTHLRSLRKLFEEAGAESVWLSPAERGEIRARLVAAYKNSSETRRIKYFPKTFYFVKTFGKKQQTFLLNVSEKNAPFHVQFVALSLH
ncbi:unnamed protein product, partial [Mesorhabditis belari]|uniref:Uncharacterized protein n=1 Tax=Mesorhabditis belari TaxID=2138241 RepID=A0AAF3FGR9_9BILA